MAKGIAAIKTVIITILIVVALWFVVQAWVLPMLGVST